MIAGSRAGLASGVIGRIVSWPAWSLLLLLATLGNPAGTASAAGLVGARAEAIPLVATQAHLENRAETAELSMVLSRAADASAFTLAAPDRIIVDLPQTRFDIDPLALTVAQPNPVRVRRGPGKGQPTSAGLIASVRFGLLAPGRSRIVIDLARPARIVSTRLTVGQGGAAASRLVVTLAASDRASFAASVRDPAPAPNLATLAANTPSAALGPDQPTARPTVVIDPGHGGPDNGAVHNGVVEKTLTLAFAQALAAKLAGHFNVVLTRTTDVFIPLSERVRIARQAGAALMVSIHADLLPGKDGADVSGATVYTLSDRASDADAATVAAKENAADAAAGVAGQADIADVNDILFDLTRRETRAYSHVFARTLVNYWKVAGRLNKNPQRSAGFVVLKAPDVPSVLVELGYLSSATDAAAFQSDEWRAKSSARMADAVEAYFAGQTGTGQRGAGPGAALLQQGSVSAPSTALVAIQ